MSYWKPDRADKKWSCELSRAETAGFKRMRSLKSFFVRSRRVSFFIQLCTRFCSIWKFAESRWKLSKLAEAERMRRNWMLSELE